MMKPLVIYIDMDDVLCDFSAAHTERLAGNPGVQFPQSQYGFFASLKPIDHAIESVKQLINDAKFEVYILTAPSYMNPLCYTEKRVWIEQYFGLEFTKRLIISYDKSLLKGDVLIDDRVSGNGQESFEGLLIQFGGQQFTSWHEVMSALRLSSS